jgi:hypothetical protein
MIIFEDGLYERELPIVACPAHTLCRRGLLDAATLNPETDIREGIGSLSRKLKCFIGAMPACTTHGVSFALAGSIVTMPATPPMDDGS